ncbi:hypothetical protein LTR84_009111 [Exophiala bonariae]|uniref:2-oxoadipate dioxygenase/decarboxylase n=1 Tax=Exophiala bonariae TaxID=1690606 RepID=A0AAV9MY02_9EURO|nr:hypothetical protein LTR84_009111 [Exophiala bonariae]
MEIQSQASSATQDLEQRPLCDPNDLRTSFALAMSAMYRTEVPLYGELISIVRKVNQKVAEDQEIHLPERLDLERHGAIRLGTPTELHTVRRVFALIGLYPVDYYDLSVAGLPMHATAFRPIDPVALSKNPFRVFTTLLRPELLDSEPKEIALDLLDKRRIFSEELLQLTTLGEEQGGLWPNQGTRFITEALRTFQWRSLAATTYEDYHVLAQEHPILADIACFNSAHINHLTPRTLDIDMTEKQMKDEGLAIKSRIEGPPTRQNPILLRQTSFLALEEQIRFPVKDSINITIGHHRARFGEIEQRGAAVTIKGRQLYDRVLDKALTLVAAQGESPDGKIYEQIFQEYPDDWETLVRQGLIYCEFHCTDKASNWIPSFSAEPVPLMTLLNAGIIKATPITYEDFLPFSAAGIFQSNLQSTTANFEHYPIHGICEDKEGLIAALGCPILESQSLYANIQAQSLANCAQTLAIQEISINL